MVVSPSMTMLWVMPAGIQSGALRRHDPDAVVGRNPHGPCGRVDELGALMMMRQDLEARGEVLGHGRDSARDVLIVLWIGGALAVSRHRLAF